MSSVRCQPRLRRRAAYAALSPVPRRTSVAGSGVGTASWNSYMTRSVLMPLEANGWLKNVTVAVPRPRNAPEKIDGPAPSTLSWAVRKPDATKGTRNEARPDPSAGTGTLGDEHTSRLEGH